MKATVVGAGLWIGFAGVLLAAAPEPGHLHAEGQADRPAMTQPSATQPSAAQPSAAQPMTTLPAPYSILLSRSLFTRGGIAAPPVGMAGPQAASGPEGALALRGVVRDDADFIAFVEDTTSHHTLRLKPGDAVGEGRIGDFTLDSVEYKADGAARRIRVGENLLGAPLPPATQPSPQTAPAGQPAPGGPPEATPPPGATMPSPMLPGGPGGHRGFRRMRPQQ